jgi:5-methylcytosine-specific restriction enzyme B
MNPMTKEFSAALAAYDRAEHRSAVEQAERERNEVTGRFPLNAWPTLPLQRYALGQEDSEDTFCRWMEFRTRHLGSIRGGTARKLILYKHRKKPGWYFDSATYRNEEEAWAALRSEFLRAFEDARTGRLEAVDDLQMLQSGPALCLKTLHVYFPGDVLPVYSRDHLRHFLRLLGSQEDLRTLGAVRLNGMLLAMLRQRPELRDWSTNELQRFLYRWADPRDQRRIVKIAPGELGEFWEDCLGGSYICVGWDEVGDLREFESKEEFREAFAKHFPYNGNSSKITKKSKELWTLMELEPGDLVFANRGTSEILGLGTVVEPGYDWRPDRETHRHILHVRWDTSVARAIPPQPAWAFITVGPVAATQYEAFMKAGPSADVTAPPVDPRFVEITEALEDKRQAILYGPPGTGKTFHARRFAVAWLLKQNGRAEEIPRVLADRAAFAEAEEALARPANDSALAAQLTRLTFHPSYSYEDFIEGFRPSTDAGGALSLRLEDGVFKRVCEEAQVDSRRKFLVLIDEINRANLAKVFGELLTLLEVDKRGLSVTLPQSKKPFRIPDNVYLVGTMNTADRSIKLLDTALRRRFSFVEFMPDVEVLRGAKVGTLALDDFLENLNRRIGETLGREKQVGQSYLLNGSGPIVDPQVFARRFRHEILPLLQEYCYDDYRLLATYLGSRIVDPEGQGIDADYIDDAGALVEALTEALGTASSSETPAR